MTLNEAKSRVDELRELLDKANKAYYTDARPFISDREYDAFLDELNNLEEEFNLYDPESPTQRVGGEPTDGFTTVTHPVPMLSLDNTYNEEELTDFDRRVRDILGHSDFNYLVEMKFDGAAMRLRYENGELVLGATRGNGTRGDDITTNVKTIQNIPLHLDGDYPPVVEVRGEAYMEKAAFVRMNEYREEEGLNVFANPRNATAGSLKMLDPRTVVQRPIKYFAYDLLTENPDHMLTQHDKMMHLKSYGLPVSDHFVVCENIQQVHRQINKWEELRHELPFETDGVVIKVNQERFRDELGATSKAPRWAIAYKYEAEQATTKINSITLQVGRLGTITPVAELAPVQLAGTTVKRASLHNEDEIHRKDIREGDKVTIEKAGEIIPQVVSVLDKNRENRGAEFHMPENCPACDEKLVRLDEEVAWRCINPECPPQVRSRIEHFASRDALDIEGLGESIVDQLVSHQLVQTYVDLYELTTDQLIPLERMGHKSAQNLVDSIEKSKQQSFDRVIYALGIRFVGKTVARDLARAFKSMNALMKASMDDLKAIDSIGPRIAESVTAFFDSERNRQLIESLRNHGLTFQQEVQETASKTLEGFKFVLTGSLPRLTRKEAKTLIEKHGGKTTSSVSGNTDYVLVGDSPGSKYDKAVKLEIPILDESSFLEMIGEEMD